LNEDGTANVCFTSSKTHVTKINRRDLRQVIEEAQGGTNPIHEFDDIEATAAAEVATAGSASSAKEGSVEAPDPRGSPAMVSDGSDSPDQQRKCVAQGEAAARLRWKSDVNAKYREVGAGLLRIMCITDYFLAVGIDVWTEAFSSSVVQLSSLSDETTGILQARALQLEEQKYGTYTYETMLKWLRGTQLSDARVSSDNEEQAENRRNQESRDEMVIEAAGALIQGKKNTDLVNRIQTELDKRRIFLHTADQ
jgi:hypothetical protein